MIIHPYQRPHPGAIRVEGTPQPAQPRDYIRPPKPAAGEDAITCKDGELKATLAELDRTGQRCVKLTPTRSGWHLITADAGTGRLQVHACEGQSGQSA